MVAAEGDLAAQAGLEVLKHGGNAVDAAVATSLVLGVTNSGSCGIGGGGFMLIYIAKEGKFYALDYRETAPHAASADMYYRDGKPNEDLAKTGPLAVAVPGEIAGLDAALLGEVARGSSLPTRDLVEDHPRLAVEQLGVLKGETRIAELGLVQHPALILLNHLLNGAAVHGLLS